MIATRNQTKQRRTTTLQLEQLENREALTVYWSPATGAHHVYGAIEQKYLSVGGPRSFLGYPLNSETGTPDGRGRFNHFQGGSIYWTPQTGAKMIWGDIRGQWASMGWENSFLRYPVTDELGTPDGRGRFNHFEGGSIYWTPQTGAREVHGAIRDKWAAYGWERSFIGYPVTNELGAANGGRYSVFQGATILWHPSTGANEVHGAIRDEYIRQGSAGGFLGYPMTDERGTPDGRGRYNHFQGGSIYWTAQTGAREVHGAIRDKWASMGWERSFLGYPLTNELATPDGRGRFNHFQGGSIYWSPQTGAREVHGAIRDKWASMGWERSFLGLPLTDEMKTPDGVGRFTHFQGGSIYWTPQTGAKVIYGAIRDKWASMGWERSFLRYPTTDELGTPDGVGRFNHFQGGSIYWTPRTGAREVHGAIRDLWASMGWERSFLGYPVTDELAGANGSRYSVFQGGTISWTAQGGARVLRDFGLNDQFSFGNFKFNISYPLVRDAFGKSQTTVSIGPISTPIPSPGALAFTAFAAAGLNGKGACFGEALTALRMFHNPRMIHGGMGLPAGQAPLAKNLVREGNLTNYIERQHLHQFSSQSIAFFKNWQSRAILGNINSGSVRSLMNGYVAGKNPPIVSINQSLGKGHAMVATGVQPGSSYSDFYITVYDPNRPQMSPRIHVYANNRWDFQMNGGSVWSGGMGSLMLMPFSLFPETPRLPTSLSGLAGIVFGDLSATDVLEPTSKSASVTPALAQSQTDLDAPTFAMTAPKSREQAMVLAFADSVQRDEKSDMVDFELLAVWTRTKP